MKVGADQQPQWLPTAHDKCLSNSSTCLSATHLLFLSSTTDHHISLHMPSHYNQMNSLLHYLYILCYYYSSFTNIHMAAKTTSPPTPPLLLYILGQISYILLLDSGCWQQVGNIMLSWENICCLYYAVSTHMLASMHFWKRTPSLLWNSCMAHTGCATNAPKLRNNKYLLTWDHFHHQRKSISISYLSTVALDYHLSKWFCPKEQPGSKPIIKINQQVKSRGGEKDTEIPSLGSLKCEQSILVELQGYTFVCVAKDWLIKLKDFDLNTGSEKSQCKKEWHHNCTSRSFRGMGQNKTEGLDSLTAVSQHCYLNKRIT